MGIVSHAQGRNVMTKSMLITQSSTKRATAAAIAEAKARNDWSNRDAGDALGCGEGTIRNRIDAEDAKNQMTVHELLRSIQADGPHIANRILEGVAYRVLPKSYAAAPDALAVAGGAARCAAEIIAASPGGFDRNEAAKLIPIVVEQQENLAALEQLLRECLAGRGIKSS